MGRKYVRDKAGRFAPKGGGSKGKGGKMGKSTKNVKARAAYKKASGKLRSMKKISGGAKDAKDRKFWNKSLGGAKSGMTRVTNRLTNKRAAKARTGANKPGKLVPNANKLAASKTYAAARKAKKGSAARKDAVASAKIKRGERRVKAAKKTTAAKKATAAKKKTYKGLTPKQQYKAARSKARAAKSGYAQDRGQGYDRAGKASGKGKVKRSMKLPGSDSARGVGSAKAQVTKLQKKFGKGATKGKGYGLSKKGQTAKSKFKDLKRQRGGVTKGRGTVEQRKKSLNVRTTQQAFGMKVKKPVSKAAQKYIGKQNVEASRVEASRGKGSKAQRRIKALRDAKNLRNAAKASNTPKGAKKNYIKRANEIAKATRTPKATVGRKEKAAYKAKTPDYKRATARDKKYGNPYGSQELGGGIRKDRRSDHSGARGKRKRKGAKTYDNTMSQFDTIKSTKLRLKRKYKYGL